MNTNITNKRRRLSGSYTGSSDDPPRSQSKSQTPQQATPFEEDDAVAAAFGRARTSASASTEPSVPPPSQPSLTQTVDTPTPPVDSEFGYTEQGELIIGYTSSGRPIVAKGSKKKQVVNAPVSNSANANRDHDKEKVKRVKPVVSKEDVPAPVSKNDTVKDKHKEKNKDKAQPISKGKTSKKTKVEDLKGKVRSTSVSTASAKASSPNPSSRAASEARSTPIPVIAKRGSSIPVPAAVVAEEEDEEDDEIYCPCGKIGREDGNDDLVGCDACDHWYHAGCAGLKEEDLGRIDSFICSSCEKVTTQRTTFLQSCFRPNCPNTFARRQSKFCSSSCGIKHAKSVIAALPPKSIPELSASLSGFPSPPPDVRIVSHASVPDFSSISDASSTSRTMTDLQDRIQKTRSEIAIVQKRQKLLESIMSRCETLPSIHARAGEDDERRKEKRGKSKTGGAADDRPCGYTEALRWDDDQIKPWDEIVPDVVREAGGADQDVHMEGDEAREGQGVWGWCTKPRKRCDRHNGWQKTAPLLLDRELEELIVLLEEQLRSSTAASEANDKGKQARDALLEKLSLHVAMKVK